jgi:hypothetical protein
MKNQMERVHCFLFLQLKAKLSGFSGALKNYSPPPKLQLSCTTIGLQNLEKRKSQKRTDNFVREEEGCWHCQKITEF